MSKNFFQLLVMAVAFNACDSLPFESSEAQVTDSQIQTVTQTDVESNQTQTQTQTQTEEISETDTQIEINPTQTQTVSQTTTQTNTQTETEVAPTIPETETQTEIEVEPIFVSIPSLLQAEDLTNQSGIEITANEILESGYMVDFIQKREFIEFTINVPSAGIYYANIKTSSPKNGGLISFTVDDQEVGLAAVARSGGWNDWIENITKLNLVAGEQTLRLNFNGSTGYLFNLDWIEITDEAPVVNGPGDNWTFCSNENDFCEFTDGYHVAYGVGSFWESSVEVDGIDCSAPLSSGPILSIEKTCWIRPANGYAIVRSIEELRDSMALSDQKVRMKRGSYVVEDLLDASETLVDPFVTAFVFDGSNNQFDMTGVSIDIPVELLSTMPANPVHSHVAYKIYGNDITILNGTFENTYPNGQHDVTDFTEHNSVRTNYWPSRQMSEFLLAGDNISIIGSSITIRGSYPYGYGDIFGDGLDASVYLRKHSGFQIIGDNALIDGVDLTVLAFGYGIFMQGAQDTVIQNTNIQGRMRLGSEMLAEDETSLPGQFNYEHQYPDYFSGFPIKANKMYSLTEDGIAAFSEGVKLDGTVVKTGAISVENSTITNMRGCIETSLAAQATYISNVEVKGCSIGYALASESIVEKSTGDSAYGVLYTSKDDTLINEQIELTLKNDLASTGDHKLALIAGSGHRVVIKSDGSMPDVLRVISVGDTGEHLNDDPSLHDANNISLVNETQHSVILNETTDNITVISESQVNDNGDLNIVNP